jgi:hypothetical protein
VHLVELQRIIFDFVPIVLVVGLQYREVRGRAGEHQLRDAGKDVLARHQSSESRFSWKALDLEPLEPTDIEQGRWLARRDGEELDEAREGRSQLNPGDMIQTRLY